MPRRQRQTYREVIDLLQDVISMASTEHGNDRNTFGFEHGQGLLETAFNICVAARGATDEELAQAMNAARAYLQRVRNYHQMIACAREKKGQA